MVGVYLSAIDNDSLTAIREQYKCAIYKNAKHRLSRRCLHSYVRIYQREFRYEIR